MLSVATWTSHIELEMKVVLITIVISCIYVLLQPVQRKKIRNKKEYARQLADNKSHPEIQYTGVHMGCTWTMDRSYGYWCAWIDENEYTARVTPDQFAQVENIAHGGLTWAIGFDCNHSYDYHVGYDWDTRSLQATYKDFHYVHNNLMKIIEAIVPDSH